MSRRIARLAVASLAVLLGTDEVAAQEPTPYYEWSPARTYRAPEPQRAPEGAAPAGEAVPQAGVEALVPDPATFGRGRWSLGLVLGADGLGVGFALQGALGLGTVGPVRVDVLADVQRTSGRLEGGGGGDLSVARGALLLALSTRYGAIEPWVAAGVGRAAAESTSPTTVSACVPVVLGCYEWETETGEDADAGGPVIAAGVRLAVTRGLLVGIEVRKALIPEVRLGATPVALDRLFVGGGLTWRTGGPAVGAR